MKTKRIPAFLLALVMVFSLTVSASAADTREQVTAYLNYNLTVRFNGEARLLGNVNGDQVYPVTYGGTTYVPIRAIGNLLGLDVTWLQDRQTVRLSDAYDSVKPVTVKPDTSKKSGLEAIRPVIDPGITVVYNGKEQEMKTVKGETVYPMLNGGTTYLPIRAVGDMLGLEIGWEQATQTVTLDFPKHDHDPSKVFDGLTIDSCKVTVFYQNGTKELFGLNELDDIWEAAQGAFAKKSLEIMLQAAIDKANGVLQHLPERYKTSDDADVKKFDDTHIGRGWGEIDWSSADNGYVTVKVNELPGPHTYVRGFVTWGNEYNVGQDEYKYYMTQGTWKLPLPEGDTEYAVSLSLCVFDPQVNGKLTDAEAELKNSAGQNNELTAKFRAKVERANNLWLSSTPEINIDNAPKTRAKALEITKNCKTDAEKVTAVFNWVYSNITYDNKLYNEIMAWNAQITKDSTDDDAVNSNRLFKDGARMLLDLDNILTSRSGVCEDKAALMAGMLRSIGIPCKVVSGEAILNSDGKGIPHAWVAVSPELEDSLNMSTLGAGHEPDGWIRLDPTNAHVPNVTRNDKNYTSNAQY